MNRDQQKQLAAEAAIKYINNDAIVGIGTGSTVNYFIAALVPLKGKLEAVVSSSKASTAILKSHNITVSDLNSVSRVDVYVDGADAITKNMHAIKGGGGALTGEKIIAQMAKQFICIADASKLVPVLGKFPVPIEVIPMARSFVAREIVKLGGDPVYREGFVSDYGNIILDVHNLELLEPSKLEETLNQIPGIVTNGIFARRPIDVLLLGKDNAVITIS